MHLMFMEAVWLYRKLVIILIQKAVMASKGATLQVQVQKILPPIRRMICWWRQLIQWAQESGLIPLTGLTRKAGRDLLAWPPLARHERRTISEHANLRRIHPRLQPRLHLHLMQDVLWTAWDQVCHWCIRWQKAHQKVRNLLHQLGTV